MAVFIQPLQSQTPSTDISFEERVYDFGTVNEAKGKVSHTFVFQNKGKTPVTVNDVYSACGCIGKVVSKSLLKPGDKGKVTITFDPAYKSGFFSKEIVVFSNNGKNYNRIWVEGIIKPAVHPIEDEYPYNFGSGLFLRLKVMAFGYMKHGETKVMELHYANSTDSEMNLVFQGNKNELLKFKNPGKIGPKQKGVIRFSFTMPGTAGGDINFLLTPYINGKKLNENLTVRILNGPRQKQLSKVKN
jgi:hypothetical protein